MTEETPGKIEEIAPQQYQSDEPGRERRSPYRDTDVVRFNMARLAIEAAKQENPEDFNSHYSDIDAVERVAKNQFEKEGKEAGAKRQFIKEYHAMRLIADSYDSLTGTLDRSTIKRQVKRVLDKPTAEGKSHIYIDMDINGLKAMNEQSLREHSSADEALKGFASFHMGKFAEAFGYRARIGRLSGDEFAVIVENSTTDEIKEFFDAIEEERGRKMRDIVIREQLPSDITAMIAIIEAKPNDSFQSIHERADKQLIEQKRIRNMQKLEQSEAQTV